MQLLTVIRTSRERPLGLDQEDPISVGEGGVVWREMLGEDPCAHSPDRNLQSLVRLGRSGPLAPGYGRAGATGTVRRVATETARDGRAGDLSNPVRAMVGIAGAGQLARMTCLAAWPLGISVAVLGSPSEPSAGVCHRLVEGDWHNAEDVAALGAASGVVTLENEFVDAPALVAVEDAGTPVRPRPGTVGVIQDKADQKERLAGAGIPVPRFAVARTEAEIDALGRDLGWPLMIKARRLGYDGRGNALAQSMVDVPDALERLDRGEGVLVEEHVPFSAELAAMVARSSTQELVYPVVETVQKDHVCHEVTTPVALAAGLEDEARRIALASAQAAESIGVMGVEMFLLDDRVVVNELAPRPHNSGHYSIEACETSQFENHLRGVLDLPLGPADLRAGGAAMVNLLGSYSAPSNPKIEEAMAVPGAHVHLYDKADVRPGRKMGHVTALGDTAEDALATARKAAGLVQL